MDTTSSTKHNGHAITIEPLRIVALIARSAGVELLKSIFADKSLNLVSVVTHKWLPKSEGGLGRERDEYAILQKMCAEHDCDLITIDNRNEASTLNCLHSYGHIDLMCAVSWRYVLSRSALDIPRYGVINLHRGELPKYAGARPVERMLRDKCEDAVVTAHMMVEEVDAGPVLAVGTCCMKDHLLRLEANNENVAELAEEVKIEILPLYSKVFSKALAELRKKIK